MSMSCLQSTCRVACAALGALVLGTLAAPALRAQELSFNAALERAQQVAPGLQARAAQLVAAHEDAARATALPDPRLLLGLSNVPVEGAHAFDLRVDDMTMKQVGLMQEMPARAKREARAALAASRIDAAQAEQAATRLRVREATAQAWIALWAAQAMLDALDAQREQAQLAAELAKARLAGGGGSAVDALAAQAAMLDLDNRRDIAQGQVEAARAALARWLDVEPGTLHAAGEPPDFGTLPVAEAQLFAQLDRHAALLPWQARSEVAQAAVDAAVAEKRPDWSIEASYGQRSRSPRGMPREDMLMVEFAVGLPLFSRNRQDRDIAARRADLAAVEAEHEDARRAQLNALRQALAQWHALQRLVERKQAQLLPLAHDRSQTALAAYRGGGALQPWLDARRDELDLHIDHATHLGELGRAWAALAFLLPAAEAQP